MTAPQNDEVGSYCKAHMQNYAGAVLQLIAQGFKILDQHQWWPPRLDFLKNCLPFIDMRERSKWDDVCQDKLIPTVIPKVIAFSRQLSDKGDKDSKAEFLRHYLIDVIKNDVEEVREIFKSLPPKWYSPPCPHIPARLLRALRLAT
jgi:hypothetical protein